MIPLFKAAPAAVRRLVELAADDRAAQATSPDAVRSALRVVWRRRRYLSRCGLSGSVTTRSRWRLVRLQTDSRIRGTKLVCISAAMLPMIVPVIAALTTMVVFSASAHALVT